MVLNMENLRTLNLSKIGKTCSMVLVTVLLHGVREK